MHINFLKWGFGKGLSIVSLSNLIRHKFGLLVTTLKGSLKSFSLAFARKPRAGGSIICDMERSTVSVTMHIKPH